MSRSVNEHAFRIAAAILFLSPTIAAGQEIFEDFSDGDVTDGSPVVWQLDDPQGSGTIVGDAFRLDGSSGECCSSIYALLDEYTDISVQVDIEFLTNRQAFSGVGFREFANNGIAEGYWAGVQQDGEIGIGLGDRSRIVKRGVYLPADVVADRLITYRVENIGNEITLSAWKTGEDIETASVISWTDPDNLYLSGDTVFPFFNPYDSNSDLDIHSIQFTAKPVEQPAATPIWTRVQNVGPVTRQSSFEFVPTVSTDGLTMVFSSTDLSGGLGGEEMWLASRPSTDSPFSNVSHLGNVNSSSDDVAGSLSADGLTLYFGSNRSGGDDWDIYTASRPNFDAAFGDATLLPGEVNNEGIQNSPRVSADGRTMVYHQRLDGESDRDIWMATRASVNDEFGEPRRLEMNQDDVEDWWPTMSSDGLALFVSDQPTSPNRPGGEGGEDIWVSVRESTDEPFSLPQNPDVLWPGSQINSSTRAAYPFLSPNWPELGSHLYFTAQGPGPIDGSGDIFQMTWMIPENGDVNRDGWENVEDLNDMCTALRRDSSDETFDLNGDGQVTLADVGMLKSEMAVLDGDVDLNGTVEFSDFLALSEYFGRNTRQLNWQRADFNCSGDTDFSDFLALSENFGKSFENGEAASIPEPSSLSLIVCALIGFLQPIRSRRA